MLVGTLLRMKQRGCVCVGGGGGGGGGEGGVGPVGGMGKFV